jgi:ATP-dependent helicase/nuclease subunit B
MKFTDKLADYIKSNNYDLQKLTIIVPNERAIKYISSSLYKAYQKPIFSPNIITIDKWIKIICPSTVLDKTRLLIRLFHIQKANPIQEGDLSFDQFMIWGQTLLQDFDEIDRYLLDKKVVFQNLKDISELDSWQMETDEWSDAQRKFMAFWLKLPEYYEKLNAELFEENFLYSGRAYRWVAENIALLELDKRNDGSHFVFAGFNALSNAELSIIKYMKNHCEADVFIDADEFYLNEPIHEAGSFLRKLLQELDLKKLPFVQNNLLTESKNIHLIDCAQNTGQVKVASSILANLNQESLNNTLILLADESLIVPMLRNIPLSVEKANITLGLPLKNTPAKTWVDLLFRIQENKSRFGENVIYFNDLQQFFNHPFIQAITSESEKDQISEWEEKAKKFNWIVQRLDHIEISEKLGSIIQKLSKNWNNDWHLAIGNIRKLNEQIFSLLNASNLFERAVVQNFDVSLIELENITQEKFPNMGLKSFGVLFKNHAFSKSIAYHGNPVKGLQIMGLLETRMLDFEKIIVLGLNEGNLPPTNVIDTFIPMDLRKYLGLPLPRDKQGLFAHHFYRLIHYSKDIYITYLSSGDSVGSSEPSRYILQLQKELQRKNPKIEIKKEHYHIPNDEVISMKDVLVKDEFYFKRLDEFLNKPFSASAINKYLKCPMDFYYRYILEFGEEENLEEEVASNTFGSFIHSVLEELYSKYALFNKDGSPNLTAKVILNDEHFDEMLSKYEDSVRNQFLNHFGGNESAFKTGKNLLSYKMCLELTKKILEKERKEIKQSNSKRSIYQLESYHTMEMDVVVRGEKRKIKIHGFIDRIDEVDGKMRVIDYKSGTVTSKQVTFKPDENLKNSFSVATHSTQLSLYSLMFEKKFGFLPNESSVLSLVNIEAGNFKLQSDKLSFHEIVNLFPKLLQQIIDEMYDSDLKIEHNSDAWYCQFC